MERSNLERHVHTILIGLITAGIGWLCLSTVDMRSQLASLSTDVGNLKEQIKDLKDERKEDLADLKLRVGTLEAFMYKGKIK